MRGEDTQQGAMFSYISPDQRVPIDHPLRSIREMVNVALREMSAEFGAIYAKEGRPSIPPEHLLRALLLMILYSIRSERLLMEQLNYNLLFRWFVGLNMDDVVWSASTFSKNRDRLLSADIAGKLFEQVVEQARSKGLMSDEHFTVDGTLIAAWASHKSFKPKAGNRDQDRPGGRNPDVDFHGETRCNDTHESTTDPQARLLRKSQGVAAELCFAGHALMENRSGLVVDACVTTATGTAEREAALEMIAGIAGARPITAGADKGYDSASFVAELRALRVTPHVAAKRSGSALDGRTTRHVGYALSQRKRKLIEQVFGWAKAVGPMRQRSIADEIEWGGASRCRWRLTTWCG